VTSLPEAIEQAEHLRLRFLELGYELSQVAEALRESLAQVSALLAIENAKQKE
jgi:hypothetical protein